MTMEMTYDPKTADAIDLLSRMIEIESFSRNEDEVCDFLCQYLEENGIEIERLGNNIWAKSKHWDDTKKTVLLNSHMDTVKPAKSWTKDPFEASVSSGKLYGLGSNDAGGPLVCLIQTFLHFYDIELPFNLMLAATSEEEISGANGVALVLPYLGKIDLGIVGEPTQMQMAIAEKGLIVLDCEAKGVSGHAARNEGVNAITKALVEINKLNLFEFEKVSPHLGPVKKTVTMIESGSQHNVVPDSCRFVVDVRTTECYTNAEIVDMLNQTLDVDIHPRSLRLNSSGIPEDHAIVKSGMKLGMSCYGSPTLSDQALMNFPTVKIGPGDSARSHTADEYIELVEIEHGIQQYIKLLEGLKF